ncbi:MAG: purine/pyrimidine permease [Albidovulum sp.]|nr:purine/pyrimidine permease [Albidovulum sp.]MDE0530121.1 purine/pyrimidine permease [Albidovulum sp.]
MNLNNAGIRYEPDEKPPLPIIVGLGIQLAILNISVTILVTTVVMRAAGQEEAYLSWAVFAAVAVSGLATALQALRLGRLGMGHVLMMGSSGAFIAVSITALTEGGPGLLATLVVISALFQFVLSDRLSLFRRVLTPTVSGTVLMLIPLSVMSAVITLLNDVPEESPALAGPLSAFATLLVMCGLTLKATGALRLWAPLIGVIAGAAVAASFGLYDVARVAAASWIGFPGIEWPGFDFSFDTDFWALLPGFLLAAVIGTIRTTSSAVAIQRVSWRSPKAVDFRDVQGAAAADSLGNLLCGVAGTIPNTAYSNGASMAQLTGVATRFVGISAGAAFLALAFLPKALALILAIPGPIVAAYLLVLMAMLFIVGVQMVVRDGIDYRKGLIVGISFWIGVCFESGEVFPDFFSEFAGGFLDNGMTTGGIVAIILTIFAENAGPRPDRVEVALDLSALPGLREYFDKFASLNGWEEPMASRLQAAGEEVLLTLLRRGEDEGRRKRRMVLFARKEGDEAVLEFITAADKRGNIQDQAALLGAQAEESCIEEEVSLRHLRHLATSIRHQQFHGASIVTVRVKAPRIGSSPG